MLVFDLGQVVADLAQTRGGVLEHSRLFDFFLQDLGHDDLEAETDALLVEVPALSRLRRLLLESLALFEQLLVICAGLALEETVVHVHLGHLRSAAYHRVVHRRAQVQRRAQVRRLVLLFVVGHWLRALVHRAGGFEALFVLVFVSEVHLIYCLFAGFSFTL